MKALQSSIMPICPLELKSSATATTWTTSRDYFWILNSNTFCFNWTNVDASAHENRHLIRFWHGLSLKIKVLLHLQLQLQLKKKFGQKLSKYRSETWSFGANKNLFNCKWQTYELDFLRWLEIKFCVSLLLTVKHNTWNIHLSNHQGSIL